MRDTLHYLMSLRVSRSFSEMVSSGHTKEKGTRHLSSAIVSWGTRLRKQSFQWPPGDWGMSHGELEVSRCKRSSGSNCWLLGESLVPQKQRWGYLPKSTPGAYSHLAFYGRIAWSTRFGCIVFAYDGFTTGALYYRILSMHLFLLGR